jgi:hypothetical protein
MKISNLQLPLADQLYTWPDTYALQTAQTDSCCFAPTPPSATAPAAAPRLPASWFSHRTLQTLWQAGLQMRSWPRPRPKVLPLRQSLWATTANGLHSPGLLPSNHRISGQLSSTPSNFGRDLRHKSRAVIPARGTLRDGHESGSPFHPASFRCQIWQSAPRQHALRLARRRNGRKAHRGGRA